MVHFEEFRTIQSSQVVCMSRLSRRVIFIQIRSVVLGYPISEVAFIIGYFVTPRVTPPLLSVFK